MTDTKRAHSTLPRSSRVPARQRAAATVLGLCLALVAGPAWANEPETTGAAWSYEGDTGPELWGALSPEYAACSVGRSQSPVDIPANAPVVSDVQPDYSLAEWTMTNNGHAIQLDIADGGGVLVGGRPFQLEQIHFHSPSEHATSGALHEMEMHLVHRDETGALAVLAVLLDEGAVETDRDLESFWPDLPPEPGETFTPTYPLDATMLLPGEPEVYAYPGSLTTPPCTEGVIWRVFRTPLELSASQIAAYRAIYDGTNRPTQPLNGRVFDTP